MFSRADSASIDASEPRRGAEVMLDVLRSEGVEYIFGNPGTTEIPLIDALSGVPDISYVLALQEASAVAMADGYAQASGRPGFVNLHTAGGLGHAMGSILSAQVSHTPLVITAGQQDTRHGFSDPLLSGNLVGIAAPVMKWVHEVLHPDHIPAMVRRAFNDSSAAPCGPVFLSLPMDVMERTTSVPVGDVSIIDRKAVAGSLEQLGAALIAVPPGKLALIAGDEVFRSGAGAEVKDLAEAFGAPVFGSSWPAHIAFPTSHPLWAGNLPHKASELRERLRRFDAVLVLGGHSLITYQYTEGPGIPRSCRLYQLTSDGRQAGRTYATALSCLGDIKASLQVLLPTLRDKLASHSDETGDLLVVAVRDQKARRSELLARTRAEFEASTITPFVAAAEITRAVGPDIAIVDEALATTLHVRAFLNSSSFRQYSFVRGATLGWGMPAAIGFSLGLGRRPVVSLLGDGASLYSPRALWTAARERLPVTFIILNNSEYNILKNFMRGQPHYLGARENHFIGMDLNDPAIDFLALAASMGVPAKRVERAVDIAGAVEAGIASGMPNLIEILISTDITG
jgi:benzoylformate decarboxylase